MANSDKNIRITTSKNKTTYPNIVFTGSAAGSSVITLEVLDDNTLSFTSNEGQVFSIDSNLSTGTIWAVSDISGVPMLSSSAGGTVGIAVYGGIVGIGQTNPTYKLDLKGSFGLASSIDGLYNFIFSNSAASGSNSLSIRYANSLLLYNSGNTFYTGFKSNAAANVTYTLPTNDGSSGQFLQTNGSGTLTWATATGSGGTGSTAGVGQGGQYEMAYYPGTGLSVVGSNTFLNNTSTGVVSITHTTVATDYTNGAFKVSGGVGIGGSLYVGGIGASIVGVTFSNSSITRGTWNGTLISTTYGGTGQNLGSSSGILTISSGTVSASTTSSAIASALSDETGSGSLVFNSSPSFGTGVTTGSATFAVFNTNATTINAFGAATTLSIGAATGTATFNSTDNSTSSTAGALVVSGGAGIAKSVSIAGRLQLFNSSNYTAFVSSATGNTVYVLPTTSPATGSSVLSSTSDGIMSWVPLVASTGAGSGTVAIPGAQYQIAAYYSGTGASVSGSSTFTNNTSTNQVAISHNTSSTSTSSGAFTVVGGFGIGGNAFIGGTVSIQDSTTTTSTSTGALVVAGGVGVGGKVYSDSLQTAGNAAIGGNLTVAGTVDLGNATSDTISFLGRVDTDIDPISDNTYDLGTPGLAFRTASFGGSVYFTNTSNTNIFALRAGATGASLTYILPTDTPTAGQVLAASAPSSGVVTLSWEDDQTGAPAGGITTLNTLTAASQSFATGTSGTDFGISSVTSTHTFNLPDAGSSARGVVSTGTQTFAGAKTFSSALSITSSTTSTSTTTGALVVTGGVGVGGTLFATGVNISQDFTLGSQIIYPQGTRGFSVNENYNPVGSGASHTAYHFTSGVGRTAIYFNLAISSQYTTMFGTYGSSTGNTFVIASETANSDFEFRKSVGIQPVRLDLGTLLLRINRDGNVFIPASTTSTSTTTGALVISGGAGIAGSLYTGTGYSSSISGVVLANNTVNASTYNKVTITAPATSATLTLSNGSSLITSGGHSLTFNTSNTTSLTLPTTGTLATTSNKLSDFAATTSLELKNTISDETGSGALVFATTPTFTTSVVAADATFAVFNTTATTINAFGAATAMSIGAATGKATFNSTDNSTSSTTGALAVSGGAGFAKSVSIAGRLQMFNGSNYTAFVSSATANTTYTLPATSPATGSSVLQSTAAGVMSWVPMTGGGSGSPGGTSGQIQFNNGGSFGGVSGLTYSDPGSGTQLVVNTPASDGAGLFGVLNIGPSPFDGVSLGQYVGTTRGTFIAVNAGTGFSGNFVDFQTRGVSGFAVSSDGKVTIGNNAWSLPITAGSSGQVLTSGGAGQQATWTTVSGSSGAGSGTVAIPDAQYSVAYYAGTGASVSGSNTFTNNTATGVVDINHTTESTSTTTGALVIDGGAGIAKSLFVGTTLSVGTTPTYNITNNLASFVSSVNTYNQVVVQNKNSGASASADFVLNNNLSTDTTYYGNFGMNSSAFSGSGALSSPNAVYVSATTGPLVLGTTTSHPIRFVVNNGATDVMYIAESGTAISVFTNLGMRSANDLRFWNSGNTFYAGLQGGGNTVNYVLTLPTAPVGAGVSALIVDSSGQMYFVAPGSGIAFSSATSNTPALRVKRALTIQFCAGYTPTSAGPDSVTIKIPDSTADGVTDITYRLREFDVRVETPSSGPSRLQLERFTGSGALTYAATGTSLIAGFGITLSGAAIYTTSVSTNNFAGTLVTSNDKLRVNWTLLNATHANFSIQLTMEEI